MPDNTELLQELWDNYSAIMKELEALIDDQPIHEEPFASMERIVSDTPEFARLRNNLYLAGVKLMPDLEYMCKCGATKIVPAARTIELEVCDMCKRTGNWLLLDEIEEDKDAR